jgi:recombination protein RecA
MGFSSQSAVLKREIEAKLASRIPAALSPQAQQAPRLLSTGIPEIDALLSGGLPIGGISEFTGASSSGRTSLALALLAKASVESACAYVDVDDTLDPRSAATSGVRLQNLLWVRVLDLTQASAATVASVRQVDVTNLSGRSLQQGFGAHPRTESKGVDSALANIAAQKAEARLRKREGTPGYPNRKLTLTAASQEQIAYEHFNARQADDSDPIRRADQRAAADARQRAQSATVLRTPRHRQDKPWSRLDKAIRATDQILQSGGFQVVVLDLASVPQEQALRIPSATWYRFRRAAQESDAILLLLTQIACARSSALCVLDCSPGLTTCSQNLLSGMSRSAEVARQRLSSPYAKKAPGRAVTWESSPSWMRAGGK